MRTHPEMMCSGTGGYVLSGIKVLAEGSSGSGGGKGGVVPVAVQAASTVSPAVASAAVPSDSADQRGVKRDRAQE